jgi:hypothetical protein
MSDRLGDPPQLHRWVQHALGGLRLSPEEATLFLAAALVLLPPELELRAVLLGAAPASEELRAALRELWLRSGTPPPAPTPMPLHRLSPGVLGIGWRRVRAMMAQALRAATE